ncbi:MAG: PhzF family phenazine biosynthesis protein [Chloroflexia bacterium]
MTKYQYHHVDVFTDRAFAGNQLAVFTDGRGLAAETMQAIAREMNFSETTFVLPAESLGNHFRLRIFTPAAELPMAGHPTVGTTFVLARERLVEPQGEETTIYLEEGIGRVPVSIRFNGGEPRLIRMSQLLPTFGPRVSDPMSVAAMLSIEPGAIEAGLPIEVISCGVPFLFVPIVSLQAIKSIKLRQDLFERVTGDMDVSGVFVFTREVETAGSTVHSRMFAPELGVVEDPATGSASGPVGCYLVRYGLVSEGPTAQMVSEQGIEIGRPSFVQIEIDHEGEEITGVRVGGYCHYVGQGYIET